MKIGLLIFLFLLLIAGCKSRKIPSNILPQPKMQAILWDMIRADKFLSDFVFTKDTSANKDTVSIKMYQQVFRIHHVSKEQFQESFSFYKTHPPLLKTILDSLDAGKNTLRPPPGQHYKPIMTDTTHKFQRLKEHLPGQKQ